MSDMEIIASIRADSPMFDPTTVMFNHGLDLPRELGEDSYIST